MNVFETLRARYVHSEVRTRTRYGEAVQEIEENLRVGRIIFDAAGNAVYCQHCGARISFTLPIELGLFVALLKGFNKAHRHCESDQQKETPNT